MRWKNIIKVLPLYRENFNVAIKSVKTNKLRSSLTISIIAIGITSLVGILTSISALRATVEDAYSQIGVRSFRLGARVSSSVEGRIINGRNISYSQAVLFKENYNVDALVSIYSGIRYNVAVSYKGSQTNPVNTVIAADADYIDLKMGEIEKGRKIAQSDIDNALQVCVLGGAISKDLFGEKNPEGEVISVEGRNYRVVGLLSSKGSTFSGGLDNTVVIPISNARANFLNEDSFFNIEITPNYGVDLQLAVDEAEVILRGVRRLRPFDNTDFEVIRNDSMLEDTNNMMMSLTIAAAVIGLITMLGAAVGLMNIMLVSVKERTREIGTRKALGAKSKLINQQFLIESIVIGQMGGILGVMFGVLIGNLVALATKSPLVLPWEWMLLAVLLCLFVSMASAYIPAKRAAALDPIESLRYE